ncbi:hypothetical protein BDN67DRAFT_971479 [Paxillus ammoniavirescens]|nr:hypothetical protein BDN67DRAFT_971479 [Paxillus ammoniavirescens]
MKLRSGERNAVPDAHRSRFVAVFDSICAVVNVVGGINYPVVRRWDNDLVSYNMNDTERSDPVVL